MKPLPSYAVVEDEAPAPKKALPDYAMVEDEPPVAAPPKPKSEVFDTYDGPTISAAPPKMGVLETINTMAPEGLFQKFSAEVPAAISAGLNSPKEDTTGLSKGESRLGNYRTGRAYLEERIKKAKADHPVLAPVVETLGNVASSSMLPGGANTAILLNALGGAGGDLTRAVDPDPVTGRADAVKALEDTAENAAGGFAAKMVADDVLPSVSNVVGRMVPQGLKDYVRGLADKVKGAGQDLKDYSYNRALKAVASGKNVDKLVGPLEAPNSKERIREMGKFMLEEPQEALGGQPILDGANKVLSTGERFGKVQQHAGKKYGNTVDELSSHEAATDLIPKGQLADEADAAMIGPGTGKYDSAGNRPQRDFLQSQSDDIRNFHLDEYTLKDLERLKRDFQARGDYARIQADNPEALKDLASFIRAKGEDQAEALVKQYAPELEGQFAAAKRLYRLSSAGVDASEAEAGRLLRNRDVQLSDMINAKSADPESVMQLSKEALLRRMFREARLRGPAFAATRANKAGRYLEELPKNLADDAGALAESAGRTLSTDPEHRQNFIEWLKAQQNE